MSYKWGITGTEDFLAPEYEWPKRHPQKIQQANKIIEICHHIAGWGYWKKNDGKHRGPDSIIQNLKYAAKFNANLLLNTAPLPDGSIDTQDIETLREVGRRIRKNGWPT
ncbi:MAG: alpha-L-fucosidase [Planctomycetota bacterium]